MDPVPAFEQETVPTIEAELVPSGTASFVFRGLGRATHSLEAVFARDEAAFRALKDHYDATQPEFSSDNDLDRTRSFLASETAVENGATVQADPDAGRRSDRVARVPRRRLPDEGRRERQLLGREERARTVRHRQP